MATRPTRAEARAETQREILRVGREQLGEVGAAALSLRAVARELGMVSSAIYRYVESRDELLTRLIDDAYNSMGAAVESVVAACCEQPGADRWVAAAHAARSWALGHPHEYSLLYGSPVPGYQAPELTAVSGTRVTRSLISIVSDAAAHGPLHRSAVASPPIPEDLAGDFERLRDLVDLDVADAVILDVLIAWTQLFGLLGFELFNQTRGVVTAHEALFDAAARRMAALIGLP